MINFSVFEADSGRILRSGICSDEDFNLQIMNIGEGVIEGVCNPDDFYVAGGAIIQKSPRPSMRHEFDWTAKQWVDLRTIQDFKDAKWAEIKQARADAIDAPLDTPYGTFDADSKARTAITDAVLMLQTLASLGTPTTIDFTLADNSTVTLDTVQMVTVGLLLGQKVQAAHSRSRLRREAIETATTAAEVDAVAW